MSKTTPNTLPNYDSNEVVQPLLEIADANRQAFEALAELQTRFLTKNFEANVQQFQNLMTHASDPEACAQSQLDFIHQLESSIADTCDLEYQALHQAHEKISGILASSTSHHEKFFESLFPFPYNPTQTKS